MDDYYYFDDEKYIQESEYDEYNGEGSRTTDEERPLKLFQVEEKQGTNENNNARRARTCSETWKYFNTQDTQHPTKVICKKCNQMYSKSTGFNILKTHLLSVHGIKIDNVKKMQTELNFLKFDPLPKEEKLARDQALVDWIIADSQPISVVTNIHFINSIKALDPRYHLPGKTSVEEMVLERFNEMRKNVNGIQMLAVNNQEIRILMPTEIDWNRIKLCLFETGIPTALAISEVTSLLSNYHHVPILENHETEVESENLRQYFQRLKKQRLNHDNTFRYSSVASSGSSTKQSTAASFDIFIWMFIKEYYTT
ncbi:41_t:CDS:2 [Funneliformis geosporum]|uniref:41_t:CDS:1 n=1 Tax=Funneliformis geosporum TaxID=1117311 RepID=A0A9W4SE38_9GLOM|nr:41_t:CDS:2 [Funneliformis geosporum]